MSSLSDPFKSLINTIHDCVLSSFTLSVHYKTLKSQTFLLYWPIAIQHIDQYQYCLYQILEMSCVPKRHAIRNIKWYFPEANLGDLKATVTSPSGKTEKAEIFESGENTYSIRFIPHVS